RLRQDAEQVLHVVADLVRDHVGLREPAGLAADVATAKARRNLIEEGGIEVDLLIGRAIERAHGALRHPAAIGAGLAAVEDQDRRAIGLAVLGEDLLPLQVGAAQDLAHEAADLVLGRAGARGGLARRLDGGGAAARRNLAAADQQGRVDAERPADEAEHHDRPDSHSAADGNAEAAPAAAETAVVAAILDVAGFRQIVQSHGLPSLP